MQVLLLSTAMLQSCSSGVNHKLLEPSKNAINPRLLPVDVITSNSNSNSEAFKREVEKNITSRSSDGKTYGTLTMTVSSDYHLRPGGAFGLAFFSGFTLGIFNLLGMPASYDDHYLSIEVAIYDKNDEFIRDYRYSLQDRTRKGIYYPNTDDEKANVLQMKKILKVFKYEIQRDADYLNKRLSL